MATGSRIRQPNLASTRPVTVINSEELTFQGATRVEDPVNNLPQAFADQGGNISNGSSGTATINLRNPGVPRTLVLIDRRRMSAGPPGGTETDIASGLNQIPGSLVEHVDVGGRALVTAISVPRSMARWAGTYLSVPRRNSEAMNPRTGLHRQASANPGSR